MNPDHTRDSNKTVKTTVCTSDYKYKACGREETVLYMALHASEHHPLDK